MTLSADSLALAGDVGRGRRSVRRLGGPAEADELFLGETGELPDACSLFLDVHGSTSHLQAVGDGEVQEAFGGLIEGIGPIILGWGGYFAQVAGDGTLVLFAGAHGADRAVAAATAIQNLAIDVVGAGFGRYTGRKFAIGIGIDQGDVRVRRVLPTSIGLSWLCLCTNTSAKLADAAPMGSVYATQKVLRSLTRPAADLAVAWRCGLVKLKIGEVDRLVKIGIASRNELAGRRSHVPARLADDPSARGDLDGEPAA
jgi:class 3 adenylate cyclase